MTAPTAPTAPVAPGAAPDAALDAHRARSQADLARRLPGHVARLGWDAATLRAHRAQSLDGLLRHAVAHSAFHRERLAGVDLAAVTPDDLSAMPVMTKADLMAHYDDVVTDPRLTLERVEACLSATGADPVLLDGEFVCLASGGSSGVRGVYAWHWSALTDYALGLLRGGMTRLLEAGGPPPGGVPMAMVTAGSAVHATRAVPGLLSGGVLRAVHVPATSPFDEIVARLEALRPVMLQSYPSVLRRLAAARRDGRLTITPMSVTATGETFPADLRAEVAEAFGVPVADQFGSSEGLVGVSPPGADGIVLADDLAVVELVDAQDRPVPPGVPSDAVLVTGLVNRAQPLVRFRIEDRMVRLPGPAGTPWTVVCVEGRSDDVLDVGGRVLHPLVVRTVLARRRDVAEYRVRQAADGIDVDVVVTGEPGTASVTAALRAAVAAAGLPDLAVRVHVVDGLRGDPGSGKVRRFVPL